MLMAATMFTAVMAPDARAATYFWTSGDYMGPDIAAGDVLTAQTNANKFFVSDFTNAGGQVDWIAGNLYFGDGSLISNSGVWLAQGDNGLFSGSGGGSFFNSGIFRKNGGTGTTTIGIGFTNHGTIDAATGTIRFVSSDSIFNAGTAFTGAGVTQIAGNAQFNGGFTSTNLDFVGGTYTGGNARLGGAADFVAGVFAGDWTVGFGSSLTITTAANKFIGGTFTNEGTVNWSEGNLYLQGGGTLTNEGSWIAGGDDNFNNGSGNGTLVNNGLFRKDGGAGITAVNTAFVNNGTIDAVTGTIRFTNNAVFNAGTVFTGAGVTQIAGNAQFNGGFSSANLDFTNGTYTGSGAVLSGSADFIAGTFAGSWTIGTSSSLTIMTAANKFIGGAFTNAGTVNWSGGDLYLQGGGTLTNEGSWIASGNNSINNGSGNGTLVNNGLFRKDGGAGITAVNTAFVNNGTIDAATGTIRFASNGSAFNAGTAFTGVGVIQIAGDAQFNGGFSSANLDFTNGTYTGSGAVLSGSADFLAGTFAGDWTIGAGAGLAISTAANKFIGGAFTNAGTVNWSEGNLYLQGGGTLTNEGSWIASGDDNFNNGSGNGTLVNNGLFLKDGGTGTTAINTALVNNGIMDVRSGTIALPINFINDGTLAGTGAFSLSGTLTNAGTMAPGAGGLGLGTLTVNGNFAQTAAGLLEIQFGLGTTDLLLVNGAASLNGALGLSCFSCVFNVGDIFTLLDATGSLTGAFSSVITNGFLEGFAYSLLYDTAGSRVQLRIDNVGTPSQPPAGAVPEPSSWAMLLLGFGSLGAVLRRRGRTARRAAA